jgi:hypothetical protein
VPAEAVVVVVAALEDVEAVALPPVAGATRLLVQATGGTASDAAPRRWRIRVASRRRKSTEGCIVVS